MSTAILTDQEIHDEMARTGAARSDIQKKQSLFARAKSWVSPKNSEFAKAERELADAQERKTSKEREMLELVERRETLIRTIEQTMAKLKRGKDQIAGLPSVVDQVAFFKSNLGLSDHEELLTGRAGAIVTLEKFHAVAAEWLVETEAELSAAQEALRDFDRVNKIRVEAGER